MRSCDWMKMLYLDMVLWRGLDSPGQVGVYTSPVRIKVAENIYMWRKNIFNFLTYNPSRDPSSKAWHSDLFWGMVWRMFPSAVTYPMAHWPNLKKYHGMCYVIHQRPEDQIWVYDFTLTTLFNLTSCKIIWTHSFLACWCADATELSPENNF